MRKLLTAAVLALALPLGASAQVSIGARVGLGLPMGDAVKDAPMKDGIALAVPLQLDVMYNVTPQLGVGVYGGWAWAKVASDQADFCDLLGADCSASVLRLGVKGEYAIGEGAGFKPFVGAALGYERGTTKVEIDGDWAKNWASGWEFGLEAGADMPMSDKLKVGAFIGISFGQYGTEGVKFSSSSLGDNDSASISDKAMHEWLTIGIRGSFGL